MIGRLDEEKCCDQIINVFSKIPENFNVKLHFLGDGSQEEYLKELSKSKRLITGRKLEFLSSIGVSDGRYFADDNINIINIGPGSGSEGHKSNEKIINKDLIDYFYLLENFLLKF